MKNLLAYTPETFDDLEFEAVELNAMELESEESELRGRPRRVSRGGVSRPRARSMRSGMPRRNILSKRGPRPRIPSALASRLTRIPRFRPRPLHRGTAASFNIFSPVNTYSEDARSNGGGAENTSTQGSEYIRWVQETLNRILGLRLLVDGIMNRETRSAVRTFQERRGLPITGLVGPDTEEALLAACPQCPQAAAELELLEDEWEMDEFIFEIEPFGEVEEYESEVAQNNQQRVRWIQETLNKILRLHLKIDGIMGPQTRSAVRSFQQKNGLLVDGVVGQSTYNALLAAVQKNTAPSNIISIPNRYGSSDFRNRAIKVLTPLPPYPQEITSNGPKRDIFTQMTGLTHEALRAAWARGENLTSCNAFTGWFSRAMGSKAYLGRFDLEKFAKKSWVPASSGRTPKYGDILRFEKFHVGIALNFVDGILHTAEGGQGGPRRGFDAIKRKQMPWNPNNFKGWVDLEHWIQNSG